MLENASVSSYGKTAAAVANCGASHCPPNLIAESTNSWELLAAEHVEEAACTESAP
jgi:hypothetical protein